MRLLLQFGKVLAIALCCVLLVLFTVEAAHMHAPGAGSAHCPLCAVAHLPVLRAEAAAIAMVLAAIALTRGAQPRAAHSCTRAAYSIRPPPMPTPRSAAL